MYLEALAELGSGLDHGRAAARIPLLAAASLRVGGRMKIGKDIGPLIMISLLYVPGEKNMFVEFC